MASGSVNPPAWATTNHRRYGHDEDRNACRRIGSCWRYCAMVEVACRPRVDERSKDSDSRAARAGAHGGLADTALRGSNLRFRRRGADHKIEGAGLKDRAAGTLAPLQGEAMLLRCVKTLLADFVAKGVDESRKLRRRSAGAVAYHSLRWKRWLEATALAPSTRLQRDLTLIPRMGRPAVAAGRRAWPACGASARWLPA